MEMSDILTPKQVQSLEIGGLFASLTGHGLSAG